MGVRSGTVQGREIRANRDGRTARLLQTEITSADDIQTVEHVTESGEDTSPPDNARVIIVQIGEAWKIAIAVDDQIEPEVAPGEKKLYSTNTAGDTQQAFIRLRNNGDIEVSADGNITATAAGSITGTAGTVINLNAPQINVRCDAFNVSRSDGSATNSTFTGGASFQGGQVTHNGTNIGDTHVHDGVTAGGDETGEPV